MKYNYENSSTEVFPGFYDSGLDVLNDLFNGMLPDDWYPDYRDIDKYMNNVAVAWWQTVEVLMDNEIGFHFIKLDKVRRPHQYNFSNDVTSIDVSFDFKKLCKYCFKTHAEQFDKYLHDNWSSHDGFISFIPNDIKRFRCKYNLDVMLDFCLLQSVDFGDVYTSLYEEIDEIALEHACLVDKNWDRWDFEYNNEEDCYIPTQKI